MRKTFFNLLLFFFAAVASGQPYESIFGNTSNSWTSNKTVIDGGWTDSFYVVKDTSFGGFNYKKISRDYWYYDAYYLREDTATGKVWNYSEFYQTEFLIMDLSLNVGDGFLIKRAIGDTLALVDSVYYINSKKYIRVNFDKDYSCDPYWCSNKRLIFIEGVGPNKGLEYQHIWDNNYYSYYNLTLICAFKDNNHVYFDSTYGACSITYTGISQKEDELPWKIYPNPANEYITVTNNLLYNQNIKINIFNSVGKLVKETNESNFDSIKIETANLPGGIYLVQFKSEDGLIIFFEKLILE